MWQKEKDANEFINRIIDKESKTVYGERGLMLGINPEFCVDLSNYKTYSKIGLHKVYLNMEKNKVKLFCDFRFLRQLEGLQSNSYYIPTNSDLHIVDMVGYDKNVLLHLPENITLDRVYLGRNVSLNGSKIYKKMTTISPKIDNKFEIYRGCTFECYFLDCSQQLLAKCFKYGIKLKGEILRLYLSNVSDILSQEVLEILHKTSLVSYKSLSSIHINLKVSQNDRDNLQWLYKVINGCNVYMKYLGDTEITLCLKDIHGLVTEDYKRYILDSLARYEITIPFSIKIHQG